MENTIKERYGSLRKIEPLNQITDDSIIPGTLAFECPAPFPGYYNMQEKQTVPLYVYLILNDYMHLDDFLTVNQRVFNQIGYKFSATLAAITIKDEKMYAIRVKDLEDYGKLRKLHDAFATDGVSFKKTSKKYAKVDDVHIRIKKFFKMSQLEEGYYCDKLDKHNGYFEIGEHLSLEQFVPIAKQVNYNLDIIDFDAALSCYYEDFKVHDMVRIYTESISLDLLKQIKAEYNKLLVKLNK